MGGNSHCHHRKPPALPPPRSGMRRVGGGEIVEVQGGHIVRSTGRKDRHSKVCTAKGARDRRVRLSAHTAIQFYDVQDRLGYDRPSKAVDWLIDKARAAIDELEKLPPWHPNSSSAASSKPEHRINGMAEAVGGGRECSVLSQNPQNSSSFLPPSIDTIKSFFPAPQFQNYPLDLLSRTSSQSQDLPFSLQSFEEPSLIQHQSHHEQVLFSGISHLGFDEWSWNNAGADNTGGAAASGGSGCQNQFFSQRGPLQSSNTPSIRAWMDPEPPIAASDHHQFPFPYTISGIGFHIPARIQGEEEHDGISNKPSSASSDSCH